MKKLIITLIAAFAVMFGGMTFVAPAAHADNNTQVASQTDTAKKTTKKNFRCKKTPKPFVKNGVTVISLKTCFSIKILKQMGCDTEAGKNEQPAPPRDPRSECKGWLKVDFKLTMKSPKPPKDMMCTQFSMSITIKQRMKAHALSISIANGRVDTWARTNLKLKDVIRGWIKTNCVRIPPPPPPTYDECPNIPGNQPEGYECTPPPVDNPGSIVEVTNVNDVLYGNTRTIQVRGVVPAGQTAILRVSAGIGTIASGDKTISLGAGEFVRDITYTAPTEGSTDTVTFDLYGSDNVLDDTASDTFDLRPNPVDPL